MATSTSRSSVHRRQQHRRPEQVVTGTRACITEFTVRAMFTGARVGSRHEIAQVDVAAMRREGLRASPAQRGRGAQNIKNCVFLDHVTKGRTLLWVRSCTARLTRRYLQPPRGVCYGSGCQHLHTHRASRIRLLDMELIDICMDLLVCGLDRGTRLVRSRPSPTQQSDRGPRCDCPAKLSFDAFRHRV